MRLIFLSLLLLLVTNSIFAQIIKGRIVNDNDAMPLFGVIVQNLNNSAFHAFSDNDGRYEINTAKGDSIQFSLLGFTPRIVVYNGENEGWFSWIGMKPQSFVIDTVVIHKELTKYQKDSLANRGVYGKSVDYRPAKPQLPKLKELKAGKPLVIKAPISGIIEKRQKRYKRLKAFQKRFMETETQNFIDSRYIPDSVTVLTGLKNDSLFQFMQAYPMPYSFARAASELEIKMWIRHNYKEWLKKPVVILPEKSMPNATADSLRKP